MEGVKKAKNGDSISDYRIVEKIYYNEFGNATMEHYIVEKWTKTWFYSKWKPVKDTQCYWGGCDKEIVEFKTLLDAELYIQRAIKGSLKNGWHSKVVKQHNVGNR